MDTSETLEGKRLVCSICFHIIARKERSILRALRGGQCSKCGDVYSGITLIIGNVLIADTGRYGMVKPR